MQRLHVSLGQELETLDMGAVIIPVIVIAICDMITIMTTRWDPSDAWDAALGHSAAMDVKQL